MISTGLNVYTRAFLVLIPLLAVAGCGREEIPLSGTWQYRIGLHAGPDTGTSKAWLPVTLPGGLRAIRQKEATAFGSTPAVTLRRRVPPRAEQAMRAGRVFALRSSEMGDVAAYYLNEHRLGERGGMQPYRSGFRMRFLGTIPASAVDRRGANYLYITLQSSGLFPLEVHGREMSIGPVDEVFQTYYLNEIATVVILTIYLVVGIYHLMLLWKRPGDLYNLYFGLVCLGLSVFWLLLAGSRDLVFGNHVLWRIKVEHIGLMIAIPSLLLFLSTLFEGRHSKIGMITGGISVALIVGTLAGNFATVRLMLNIYLMVILVMTGYMVYFLIRQMLRRDRNAYYLVLGMGLLLAAAVHDVLVEKAIIPTPPMARYSFVVFICGIALMLAHRFMAVHNQVEELNHDLERRVEERTEQLSNTLKNVRALKEKQDADYYLTSLLIEPLAGHGKAGGDNVTVNTLLSQMKKFRFREKDLELGGDLCVAETISLRNNDYIVFVSADAMGKSMQGAGGALVMGTVHKSIVERTRNSTRDRELYPELWLRKCFQELQSVFTTFSGQMNISAVIGLVDQSRGILYYINAEHPAIVLYRGGCATYIEQEMHLRKIGFADVTEELTVKSFQLEPGDVVLAGSDGCHDIELGHNADGRRIINEDEEIFLRCIEAASGQLAEIEEAILERGKQLDDISLLRIAFSADPNPSAIVRDQRFDRELSAGMDLLRVAGQVDLPDGLSPDSSAGLKMSHRIGEQYLRSRDYTGAARFCAIAMEHFPGDDELIFLASQAEKLLGNLEAAADLGERCRLRDPGLARNLVNLADVYRRKGMGNRFRDLLERALELEPNSKAALRLRHLGETATDGSPRPERASATPFV